MNQDTLFQAIVFGGIYAVGFFIVYLAGRNVSPSSALLFSVGSWIGLMAFILVVDGPSSCLLFVILIIAAMLVFRKKIDNRYQQFFTDNHIYKAATLPEQVSQLLGSNYYSCAEGILTPQSGEIIRYNWWQGMTSSMIKSGNAYVNTYTYYLAISFAPNVVSEAFKQVARAKADTSGLTFRQKFKRFFVLDTDTPIRVTETEDGSFVIIWQTYHDLEHYSTYINWLKANLSGNQRIEAVGKTIETDNSPALTPESIPQPVIPSSRQLHEQALGQAPKVYAHSRR